MEHSNNNLNHHLKDFSYCSHLILFNQLTMSDIFHFIADSGIFHVPFLSELNYWSSVLHAYCGETIRINMPIGINLLEHV